MSSNRFCDDAATSQPTFFLYVNPLAYSPCKLSGSPSWTENPYFGLSTAPYLGWVKSSVLCLPRKEVTPLRVKGAEMLNANR